MKKLFRSLIALTLVLGTLLLPVGALSVDQAKDLLNTYYIDDLPPAALQANTLDELLAALGDPHTMYMDAEEYQTFLNGVNGSQMVGIGVSVQDHEQGLFILSVLDNSPAKEAGLEKGDIILSVNGTAVFSIDQASTLLGGAAGTTVALSILKTDGSTLQLELTRRVVAIPITVHPSLSSDGNACILLCTSFGETTAADFAEQIREHEADVNAWIIDLSTNPGGTSQAAVASMGCFMGSGIILFLRNGLGEYSYSFSMPTTPDLTQKPAIVLTSPHSASASEVFTAATRDHRTGIAIGQRTFGKGVAQVVLDEAAFPDLFSGDALKVTVYRFFSPFGTTNDRLGVLPTLMISLENSYHAALLLCADRPATPIGHLKLTLAGHDFYIFLDNALRMYRAAFVELLEALPPSAQLYQHNGQEQWAPVTPQGIAQQYGLTEFTPRSFTDLTDHARANAINTLAVYDLVNGYGDGTFRPDATITRAEFCSMLVNVFGLDLAPVSESHFSDVDTHSWYAPAVHAMCQEGHVSGYGDGTFRPDQPITQQEVVSILGQAAARLNLHVTTRKEQGPGEHGLAPFYNYSAFAREGAWLLNYCEIDLADINPQQTISRGQAADLLYQTLYNLRILWP